MNKAELSKLLDQKVQEKLRDGYSITTYAMDAASRDRVKQGLKPQSHQFDHHNETAEAWQEYLQTVESGAYQPEKSKALGSNITVTPAEQIVNQVVASGVGLWKVRRH
ncbi:hypothetical protein ACYSUW_14900 [Pseudomonas frederiksbergensis]